MTHRSYRSIARAVWTTVLGEMADVYASKPKTGAEFSLGRPNSS
jgi:hypothetical protein